MSSSPLPGPTTQHGDLKCRTHSSNLKGDHTVIRLQRGNGIYLFPISSVKCDHNGCFAKKRIHLLERGEHLAIDHVKHDCGCTRASTIQLNKWTLPMFFTETQQSVSHRPQPPPPPRHLSDTLLFWLRRWLLSSLTHPEFGREGSVTFQVDVEGKTNWTFLTLCPMGNSMLILPFAGTSVHFNLLCTIQEPWTLLDPNTQKTVRLVSFNNVLPKDQRLAIAGMIEKFVNTFFPQM